MAPQLYRDFLQLDKTAPYTFPQKPTELAHLNEQLDQLDRHISDLMELKSDLLHRSNQLISPAYIVPNEILSYIFCHSNEMDRRPQSGGCRPIDLPKKGMTLSAVSRRWRQVALCTSTLWEKVECRFTEKLQRNASLLIQHCASHASSLDVSLLDKYRSRADDTDGVGKAIQEIFTTGLSSPVVKRKLKTLQTQHITSPQLIRLLPSFLRLENLTMQGGDFDFDVDLSTLPLSRVTLFSTFFNSLILPPSVHFLHLEGQSPRNSITLLCNCPNLVEFINQFRPYSYPNEPKPGVLRSRPLVLDSLKKLVWSSTTNFVNMAFAIKLDIPVIETLELNYAADLSLAPLTTFIHQTSATLESLVLKSSYPTDSDWSIANLRYLFKFPIPTLRKLSLTNWSHASIIKAIRALTPEEGENGYKDRCLPKLEYLSLDSTEGLMNEKPRDFDIWVLELVKRRRIGEDSHFRLDFSFTIGNYFDQAPWRPELLHEFKEFLANRSVELTVHGSKLNSYQLAVWLSRRQSD